MGLGQNLVHYMNTIIPYSDTYIAVVLSKRSSGISLRVRFYSPKKVSVFPFPRCMVTLISGCCSFVESQEENKQYLCLKGTLPYLHSRGSGSRNFERL